MRAHETGQDGDQRRLAGAVRTEQAEELALPHVEVDARERHHVAVAARDILEGNCGQGNAQQFRGRQAPKESQSTLELRYSSPSTP